MIKLENVVLASPEQMDFIIEGMRNLMNSLDRSDSSCGTATRDTNVQWNDNYFIGTNDAYLMQRLADAGSVHRKYMQMMPVYVRITAPLYWWKDFDDLPAAYTIGVISGNSNVIDKIAEKEFTLEDFSFENIPSTYNWFLNEGDLIADLLYALNDARTNYIETKNKKYWWQMIQLLPSSYNQTRNVMMNYEVLANIYRWRKDHKLDEWREFCKWIERLPYSELITGLPIESDNVTTDVKEKLCGENNHYGKYCSVNYCICNDDGICNRRPDGNCLHPEDR